MRRIVPLVLALLSCERTPTTTPDDAAGDPVGDDGEAADDGAAAGGGGDEGEGSTKPVPVQQVLEIEGPLKEAAITQLQQDQLNDLRDCFDEALQSPDGLELNGAVVVRFTVAKDGAVSSAMVELDEVGHKASAECLAKVIEGYRFPKQKAESVVHLPLYSNNF